MSLEPMPLFWLALTLLAYLGSRWLYRRSKRYLLSPLILVPVLLLAVAVPLHTAYAEYARNTHTGYVTEPRRPDYTLDAALVDETYIDLLKLDIQGFELIALQNAEAVLKRGGSVCLNSFGRFAKWISASIMPPPSLVPAR